MVWRDFLPQIFPAIFNQRLRKTPSTNSSMKISFVFYKIQDLA
jgi:hypothetical protein